MRHKLKISVSKEPQNGGVVRCRSVTLREKMLTRLLGRKERVMILIPGNTVESLDITELPEGGATVEYTSSYVPAIAAGAKTIAFGDFSYYWIADRQGRSFKRLNELFATTGQVGFMATQRVDGKLILSEAIKVLAQKASA